MEKRDMFGRGASVLLALIVAINASKDRRINKIIGGSSDSILKRPYMVSVKFNKSLCSGSIISRYHVLTALHCATNPNVTAYYVRSESDSANVSGTVTRVRHIFRPLQLDLDVAVLLLDVPLQFSEKCQPITLPKDHWPRLSGNQEALVIGYGMTNSSNKEEHGVLQSVNVTLIDKAECIEKYTNHPLRHPMSNEFCTHNRDEAKGFCHGDSGGPLVVHDGVHNIQIGVVSWTKVCGNPDWPDVYVNVSIALPWINEVMERDTNFFAAVRQFKERGGQFDFIKNHPYMVSISEFLSDPHCAGSILSPRHVLTSRNCVPDDDYYVSSATDSYDFGSNTVDRIYRHGIFDVAILILGIPLEFGENCKSITLLDTQNLQDGVGEAIVPGWGMTQKRYFDHQLRSVFVELKSPDTCKIFHEQKNLSSHEICGAFYQNRGEYCFVDQGGPLVTTVNDQEVQIGIASWGGKCDSVAWPYVYVNISSVKTWIDMTVKETTKVK